MSLNVYGDEIEEKVEKIQKKLSEQHGLEISKSKVVRLSVKQKLQSMKEEDEK